MSDDYTRANVVVRHVPDYSMEQGPDGNKYRLELPGVHEIGALIDGAFVKLGEIKTGTLHAQVQAAKDNAEASGQSAQPEQVQQTGSGTDDPQNVPQGDTQQQ